MSPETAKQIEALEKLIALLEQDVKKDLKVFEQLCEAKALLLVCNDIKE